MAYRPNFRSIVNGSVVGSNNPFRYIRRINTKWQSDDELILNDVDFNPFSDSGEFQCIVKPDWNVRFRILTEKWQGFGEVADEMGSRTDAYNVEVDSPLLPTGRWKSSLEFTLRGDGMLGIWVDGDNPSNTWGEGSFSDEVEYRLGDRSNPTVLNNGFFISFTHPYGDYDDTGTYTLKINEVNKDIMVEIIAVEEITDIPTRPVEDDSEQEPVSATDVLRNGVVYNYATGEDIDTGFTWNVQLLNYQNYWWVVSNGELVNFYSNRQEAEQAAESYISNARRRARGADDDPIENIELPLLGLGLGAAALAVLLAVVFVASR